MKNTGVVFTIPFFMHFFKINIGFFDFCIDNVINITVTNEFYNIKINQNEKNNISNHCICTSLPINCYS